MALNGGIFSYTTNIIGIYVVVSCLFPGQGGGLRGDQGGSLFEVLFIKAINMGANIDFPERLVRPLPRQVPRYFMKNTKWGPLRP